MSLRDDIALLLQGLCPERCPRCGFEARGGFCPACRDDFARIVSPCADCGLPAPGHRCPAAADWWRLDGVRAPFLYAAPLARFLQRLKYARERALGAALGRLLGDEIAGSMAAQRSRRPEGQAPACLPAWIVAVPLHPRRLRERHFNQADEIARPLARVPGGRILARGIGRRRATRPQTELSRDERLGALGGAFAVRGRLTGRDIAIVDDVMTTGATVNALAAALKDAGARRVEAWAVARAPGDEGDRAQPARNR